MKGTVFNLQRYSLHDGPGIRTVVFLKGCPLRCPWCCNPESQSFLPEVEFRETLCHCCSLCIAVCPLGAINPDQGPSAAFKIDRLLCDHCGRCAEACPHGALRLVGEERSVEEVLLEVLKDAVYYRRSGGGVTLSGGEPMAQPDFSRELLRAFYDRNLHTALETTGCASWSRYEEVLPYTDLFLFDLKHLDPGTHLRLTGVSNETILENARRLAREGASITLRVPLLPDVNLEEGHLQAIAEFAVSIAVAEVHLMSFHQLGKDKYRRLDKSYSLKRLPGLRESPEGPQMIARALEIMSRHGLSAHEGG